MENPALLGKEASAELDDVTQRFPFFQSAQLLYIKSLHNENNFLYNNQLKVAAAYAVNRKVLYDLITSKPSSNDESKQEAVSSKQEAVSSKQSQEITQSEIETAGLKTSIPIPADTTKNKEIVQPEFPKKKLTNDPDEWESGMMRQLQLLHHWQTSPEEILRQRLKEIDEEKRKAEDGRQKAELKTEPIREEEKPTATDEINTLLYVLVEPSSEDVSTPADETAVAETENQNWEIKELEEITLNTEPVEIPEDKVEQEIIREAITSSIELEVDDTLPSLEELTGIPKEQKELKPELPKFEEKKPVPRIQQEEEKTGEPVKSSEEPSFTEWIVALKKAEAEAETPKLQKKDDKLIDRFIQEQPRIQPSKTAFYNPVNMARKSVQDSDEFLTETLARIYAKQGNIPKAIRAYQKLSLKFPEKTAYFAALIEELKRTPTK